MHAFIFLRKPIERSNLKLFHWQERLSDAVNLLARAVVHHLVENCWRVSQVTIADVNGELDPGSPALARFSASQ